jgi:hypothetical protein
MVPAASQKTSVRRAGSARNREANLPLLKDRENPAKTAPRHIGGPNRGLQWSRFLDLDEEVTMDDFSIAGPSCPFCGARAFTCDRAEFPPDHWLADEFAQTHYQARACADCGNVQIVLAASGVPNTGA